MVVRICARTRVITQTTAIATTVRAALLTASVPAEPTAMTVVRAHRVGGASWRLILRRKARRVNFRKSKSLEPRRSFPRNAFRWQRCFTPSRSGPEQHASADDLSVWKNQKMVQPARRFYPSSSRPSQLLRYWWWPRFPNLLPLSLRPSPSHVHSPHPARCCRPRRSTGPRLLFKVSPFVP